MTWLGVRTFREGVRRNVRNKKTRYVVAQVDHSCVACITTMHNSKLSQKRFLIGFIYCASMDTTSSRTVMKTGALHKI